MWSIKTNISVRYQINLCVNPFVMWNNWDLYSNCKHIILMKITFHESKQFILVFHLMFFHSHFSFFFPLKLISLNISYLINLCFIRNVVKWILIWKLDIRGNYKQTWTPHSFCAKAILGLGPCFSIIKAGLARKEKFNILPRPRVLAILR